MCVCCEKMRMKELNLQWKNEMTVSCFDSQSRHTCQMDKQGHNSIPCTRTQCCAVKTVNHTFIANSSVTMFKQYHQSVTKQTINTQSSTNMVTAADFSIHKYDTDANNYYHHNPYRRCVIGIDIVSADVLNDSSGAVGMS